MMNMLRKLVLRMEIAKLRIDNVILKIKLMKTILETRAEYLETNEIDFADEFEISNWELPILVIALLSMLAIKSIHCKLFVIRDFIIEKVIAPIVELATFGFIRIVRIEEE